MASKNPFDLLASVESLSVLDAESNEDQSAAIRRQPESQSNSDYDWQTAGQSSRRRNTYESKEQRLRFPARIIPACNTSKSASQSPFSPAKTKHSCNFRIVTFNVLADAYCSAKYFPGCQNQVLEWSHRQPLLEELIDELDADIYCLQEVDKASSFWRPLFKSKGYTFTYFKRYGRKEDGCAIAWRSTAWRRVHRTEDKQVNFDSIAYREKDEEKRKYYRTHNCAIVTLLQSVEDPSFQIAVGCTHFYWDPEKADLKLMQANKFMQEAMDGFGGRASALILCGDTNSLPESKVVSNFANKGYTDAYAAAFGRQPASTNHRDIFSGTLDYIFTKALRKSKIIATAGICLDESVIEAIGHLPHASFPSDHLPVCLELCLSTS